MPRPRIGKSLFSMDYEKKFTCDMGELIPFCEMELLPGDRVSLAAEIIVRMQPLVAPVLHEITAKMEWFFVPNRLLDTDWEDFITGGTDGASAVTLDQWNPTSTAEGSLWDFLTLPTGVNPDADNDPLALFRNAYNKIYNEFYRDQNLTTEVALTSESILYRNWARDYFSSALPWQQRGTAPSLPVSGNLQALWPAAGGGTPATLSYTNGTDDPYDAAAKALLENNTIDTSGISTFDIADLRLTSAIQQMMEVNARHGARYTEWLYGQFGKSPRDERLDRAEFIAASRTPVIVSEVLQTESSDATTPQGTMAGHGITVDRQNVGKYTADEYGVLMGIMSIVPRAVYQQGIHKMFNRHTRFDWYVPLLSTLSEQAIEQKEIFASAVKAENETVFGYQGRWDELRHRMSVVCGEMRSTYDYWHISRQFSVAPTLVTAFVECDPRKDIFAAPAEPGFLVSVGNIIKAVRPLPLVSDPGIRRM